MVKLFTNLNPNPNRISGNNRFLSVNLFLGGHCGGISLMTQNIGPSLIGVENDDIWFFHF